MNKVSPVAIESCATVSEAVLNGGRDNETYIAASRTIEGPWPEAPNDEPTVNMILAAARAFQDACLDMPKRLDSECFLTDDGRLVKECTVRFRPGRLEMPRVVDAEALRDQAMALQAAIERMAGDVGKKHIGELVNAMYWDDFSGDEFRRLHYLRLWESLEENRKELGPVRDEGFVVGKVSLKRLRKHRNDIAHWSTGTSDDDFLVDIYRAINELIRRRYMGRTEGGQEGPTRLCSAPKC